MKALSIVVTILISLTLAISSFSNAELSFSPELSPTPSPSPGKQQVGCVIPQVNVNANTGAPPWPRPATPPGMEQLDFRTEEQTVAIAKRMDWDCDGVSNYDDNCPAVPNPDQRDRNRNKTGDACEARKRSKKPQ